MNKRKMSLSKIKLAIMALVMLGGISAYCTLCTLPAHAAESPVNIEIVELVDDGAGNYTPWVDIVGAMPGETYSAIPRVLNAGSISANVELCVTESGVDAGGDAVDVPDKIFEIIYNLTDWAKRDDANCYDYRTALAPGKMTEPLFTEVTISDELGNPCENATFILHLAAEGIGDLPTEPDTGDNTKALTDRLLEIFPIFAGALVVAILATFFGATAIKRRHK